ncbi:MAG TPA: histidine kinase N-terminal 7TM domain-containing protein [Patescibacteria group bacterium]|nr:histidine kinase N-terminal 7TM domain-containing protein [Patescibacteria group bacterium]
MGRQRVGGFFFDSLHFISMMCHFDIPKLLFYTHIPIFILGVILAIFIILSNKKSLVHKNLFIFILLFCIWIINSMLQWTLVDLRWNLFISRIAIIEIFSLIFFLYFTYSLTGRILSIQKKVLIAIPFLPFLIFMFTNYNVYIVDGTQCLFQPGWLYFYLYTVGIVYLLWSVRILQSFKNRKASEVIKRQIVLVQQAIAFFILWFLFIIALTYLFTILGYITGQQIALFIPVGILLFIGSITYAITRYRLMNIRLLLKKSIVYGIGLLSSATIFLLVVYIIYVHTHSVLPWIAAIFFMLVFMNYYKKWFKRFLDGIFFLNELDLSKHINDGANRLNSTKKIDAFVAEMICEIEQVVPTKVCSVLISQRQHNRWIAFYPLHSVFFLSFDDDIVPLLYEYSSIITVEELQLQPTQSAQRLIKFLQKQQASLLCTIRTTGRPLAFIFIAPKQSQQPFTTEEIEHIQHFIDTAKNALPTLLYWHETVEGLKLKMREQEYEQQK